MKNIIILLSTLCLSCQFHAKSSEGEVLVDTLSVDMSEPERVQLSPIEAGDFLMKDETAFGEIVELKGENMISDTFIWKPSQAQIVVKGNKMIVSNNDLQGSSRPFLLFEYPNLQFVRKVRNGWKWTE